MTLGRLTGLQERVLQILADVVPPWTLSGGGALAAIHTRHRETRDLDLFWQGLRELGAAPAMVERRLAAAALEVHVVQNDPAFCRLRVTDGSEVLIVDLAADPVACVEPPVSVAVGDVSIRVDTAHEILVNKLCTLLSRSELRDLDDVDALLRLGGALDRALADAPRKERGFSPLTLAWVLRDFPAAALASRLGWTQEASERLERFRDRLIDQLLAAADPQKP